MLERVFCFFRLASLALSCLAGLATAAFLESSATAETITITFEADEYGPLPPNNEATNLYSDRGISFPSRPQIVDDYTARPMIEEIRRDGAVEIVSRQPKALGVRGGDRCAVLEIQFDPDSDVRRVSVREVTFGIQGTSFEALDAFGTQIAAGIIAERNRPDSGRFGSSPSPLIRDRTIDVVAPADQSGIAELRLQPAGNCLEYLTIGEMTIESTNPLGRVDDLPDPNRVAIYTAVDHQPDIWWGGRINDVSIHPTDNRQVLAVAESGGLWQSGNGGQTWTVNDSLPPFTLNAVHHHLADPRVIVVTAKVDFAKRTVAGLTTSNGGVWISWDAGRTWSQPDASIPAIRTGMSSERCPADTDAWEIDEDASTGRVFISTGCGVSYVDNLADPSRARWQHVEPAVTNMSVFVRSFFSLAHLGGRNVIMGNGEQVLYSRDNGASWSTANHEDGDDLGVTNEVHMLGGLPSRPGTGVGVFRVGGDTLHLALTRNGGRTWSTLESFPRAEGCGGFPFAYMTSQPIFPNTANVIYGNRCTTYTVSVNLITNTLLGDAQLFDEPEVDFFPGRHADHRALGLRRRGDGGYGTQIEFLATDGGLFRWEGWRDGKHQYEMIGSGPGGINALQLYTVNGQYVTDSDSFNLAFGTQDNGLWASDDEITWPTSYRTGPEGGRIEMRSSIPAGGTDTWSYFTCADCSVKISDPLFVNERSWPGDTLFARDLEFNAPVKRSLDEDDGLYAQTFSFADLSDRRSGFLGITPAYGGRFTDTITIDSAPVRGMMQRAGDDALYIGLSNGLIARDWQERSVNHDRIQLRFYPDPLSNFVDPTMTNFGSIGMRAFQFVWTTVFAVNPSDRLHLIAPDVQNEEMMESRDGGNSWSKLSSLTDLVTDNGAREFSRSAQVRLSNVSAISFSPQNPDYILVGMHNGGALISQDGGESWNTVRGSERIPNITGFYWKTRDEIYVSSYGRGLWRFHNTWTYEDLNALTIALSSRRTPTSLTPSLLRHSNLQNARLRLRQFGADARQGATVSLANGIKSASVDELVLVVDGSLLGIDQRRGDNPAEWLKTTGQGSVYTFLKPGTRVAPRPVAEGSEAPPTQVNGRDLVVALGRPSPLIEQLPPDALQPRASIPPLIDQETARRLEQAMNESPTGRRQNVGIALRDGKIVGVVEGRPLRHIVRERSKAAKPPTSKPPKRYPPGPSVRFASNLEGLLAPDGLLDGERPITISGTSFEKDEVLQIAVDGVPVSKVQVDQNGEWTATLSLKSYDRGLHELTVGREGEKRTKVITRRLIMLRHIDE